MSRSLLYHAFGVPEMGRAGESRAAWRIHGNRLRFMAAKRENSLESVNDLSHCGAIEYGFHGMHGKSELGGRGCVSPLPPINGRAV